MIVCCARCARIGCESYKGPRPSTVPLNDEIDLGHDLNGVIEGNDDLLVMSEVTIRQGAAFAILYPLLADLVPANVKIPHGLADTTEADGASNRRPAFSG